VNSDGEEGNVDRDLFDAAGDAVEVVARVRAYVADELRRLDRLDLTDDAELVASELATNAILHGEGVVRVAVDPVDDGVRLEVHDRTRVPPVLALASADAMTGRGLRLVAAVASRWGVEAVDDGKVVWAELEPGHEAIEPSTEDLLELWDDDLGFDEPAAPVRYPISLGDVPTDLLLAAKTHVDNLVREFTLLTAGARSGVSSPVPPHLAPLIEGVVHRFAEARQSIKRQALAAASRGDEHVRLELSLGLDAADAGEDYLQALDEADAYCRANRLLTLETPPQHRVFRQWYVGELVAQLRAAGAGRSVRPVETFEQRVLRELDDLSRTSREAERAARLYEVAAALSDAVTPEEVAAAVIRSGVAALGASAGALLLVEDKHLRVTGSAGYSDQVVSRFRLQDIEAELPAATAWRTGEAVWLESVEERDARFPGLPDLEPSTISICALPLWAGGHRMGVLRFSFDVARLFDVEERRFVLSLAASAAQALERARLEAQRITLGRRLRRGLLPGDLPDREGMEVGAASSALDEGLELGGTFYDVWGGGRGCVFAMGDAAGTGPDSAALSALVLFSLRALTADGAPLDEVLRRLNTVMVDADAEELGGERSCTLLVGLLVAGDPVGVEVATAGHPGALVRRRDGDVEAVATGGTALGVGHDPEVVTASLTLEPGDALALVSATAVEARRDGRPFGIGGIRAALAAAPPGASATAEALKAAVLGHADRALDDDLAVLVLRVADRVE
jgi:serine phosphatase RsbU (regulator of sigma subunit)/anti-sigma regulatory factor (Ser/Thr protein kinase)